MSSNDFDGPHFGPASGQGADEQGAQAPGAAEQGVNDKQGEVGKQGDVGNGQGTSGTAAQYPAPEGWDGDGFWRDSAIDSNYETGNLAAVRPPSDGSGEDAGYSFFSDGKGWQSTPGAGGQPGQADGTP